MTIIPHWRAMWRAWSVRLNAVGLAILAWFAVDPISLLSVWNMMPAGVHEIFPAQLASILGAVLFALSLIAKFVRQPKLQEKIDAAKE